MEDRSVETSEQPTAPRLIVAIDESTESERVLAIAVGFAERLGASIDLVGLSRCPGDSSRVRDRLSNLIRRCGSPVESSAVVDGDQVVDALRERIDRNPMTLVMLSDHGTSRFDPRFADSLASRLLAEALPVVIVGEHTIGHPADLPVLVCLDGSDDSHQAIPVAVAWAAALRVPLVLERVAPPELAPPRVPPALAETRTSEARQDLQDVAGRVSATWPELDVRARMVEYRWGVADAVSLSLARHPAQLVVVATHVRDGWGRVTHASVTSPLVHQVTSPLLVVPIESTEPAATAHEHVTQAATAPPGPPLFETVIVPVDPAHPTPVAAIDTAATLARRAGASLSVLSCTETPTRDVDRQRREVAELVGAIPTSWRLVQSNAVADEIVRDASHSASSIVCMATEAPDVVIDTLMPTVTGTTLRWSPSVVVLVGPRCTPASAAFNLIVACVDGSRSSDVVVDVAASWASTFSLPLYLLEVVDPSTTVPGAPSLAGRYLGRLANHVSLDDGVSPTSVRLEATDAGRALRGWADQHPGALMVMGSHGDGRSAHPLGRTVQDVVRHSPVPVAVVPRRSASAGQVGHSEVGR